MNTNSFMILNSDVILNLNHVIQIQRSEEQMCDRRTGFYMSKIAVHFDTGESMVYDVAYENFKEDLMASVRGE